MNRIHPCLALAAVLAAFLPLALASGLSGHGHGGRGSDGHDATHPSHPGGHHRLTSGTRGPGSSASAATETLDQVDAPKAQERIPEPAVPNRPDPTAARPK